MREFRLSLALCPLMGASLLLCGCGYVGDPMPPALNIPKPVTNLRAVQRGASIAVEYEIPEITTDGLGLRVAGVQMLAGAVDPGDDVNAWAAGAQRIDVSAAGAGPQQHATPLAPWAGKQIWLAVRVQSHKGKWGAWSNVASLRALPLVHPPSDLRAESAAEGVRLRWTFRDQRDQRQVQILRKGAVDKQFTQVATADGSEWIDREARFGETYEYAARAVIGVAESETTPSQRFTPEDRFAPSVPTGLTAIAGIGGIELVWERSTEADVAGYRIYRAAEGEAALAPVAERVATPSYSDRQVKAGVKYRYAVAAVDQRGNESAPSPPSEVTAAEPML